jgi:hypothetical protein
MLDSGKWNQRRSAALQRNRLQRSDHRDTRAGACHATQVVGRLQHWPEQTFDRLLVLCCLECWNGPRSPEAMDPGVAPEWLSANGLQALCRRFCIGSRQQFFSRGTKDFAELRPSPCSLSAIQSPGVPIPV